MNRTIETNPNRMLGATISADNRTYGLAPARPAGQPETVADIADPYCLTVMAEAATAFATLSQAYAALVALLPPPTLTITAAGVEVSE